MKFSLSFFAAILIFVCCGSAPGTHEEKSTHPAPVSDTLINKWSREELLGQFDPATHPDFEKISTVHSDKPNIYLRREAYEAFRKMYEAAKAQGFTLKIISATRNFDYQRGIWEKKWKREKYKGWKETDIVKDILKYSSMPGTSRHHWGTDMDFNSVETAYFEQGQGRKLYEWLVQYASGFGFCQTYTAKNGDRSGYEEEKWHWTYLPLSTPMLTAYNETITYDDIRGFSGSAAAAELDVIRRYVNGIDQTCEH